LITCCRGDEERSQQSITLAKKLDICGVSQIHIREDRAKTANGRRSGVAGDEKGYIGDVAANGSKKPLGTEDSEQAGIGGIEIAKLNGSGSSRIGADLEAGSWGGKNYPPRTVDIKKLAGKLLGADNESGTPSQLISRRPLGKDPG
jgi:hypothetical protein